MQMGAAVLGPSAKAISVPIYLWHPDPFLQTLNGLHTSSGGWSSSGWSGICIHSISHPPEEKPSAVRTMYFMDKVMVCQENEPIRCHQMLGFGQPIAWG